MRIDYVYKLDNDDVTGMYVNLYLTEIRIKVCFEHYYIYIVTVYSV